MRSGPTPSIARRAEQLAESGAIDEAFRLLQSAIARDDATAAFTLGQWRLTGHYIRRDIGGARDLFGKATSLGLGEALPFYIAMLANGGGVSERNWAEALRLVHALAARDPFAREQAGLLAAMDIDEHGDPRAVPEGRRLHDEPLIEVIPAFLTAAECRYIAKQAGPMFQPSFVMHPQTGQQIRDPVRTAMFAGFPFIYEDPVLHAINRRIMAATGSTYQQGEPIQILSYRPGQEYKLHSDAMPGETNQRSQTFLVTLSDDFEGGETSFPRLDIDLRGNVGDAIHFSSLDARGRPDDRAWHAGKPVTHGHKLMLSKWIRQRSLDLSGPPGRPF